jgi:hypothetical protein
MVTDGTVNRWNADPITKLPQYTAADERMLISPLVMPGPVGAPFSARSGRRVNGAGLALSVGGSPEAWTVTRGPAVIYDPGFPGSGGWPVALPNDKTEAIGARPGAGLSRVDLIVARIYDGDVIGSGPRELKIERVAGDPSNSTPEPKALPALSFEIGRLVVPNSGAITVTQSTARTVAAGGVLPVATTAERDKLKTDGIAYRGLVVDNAQANRLERYDGTNFKPVPDDLDVCLGAFWGSGFDPAIHDHKTLSFAAAQASSSGANVTVIDLATQFVGVTGVTATPTNGNVGSGAGIIRHLSAFVVGSTLFLRCEDAAGNAVTNGTAQFSVIIHGWV